MVALGTVVLLGWAIDSETLKRIAPGLTSMKANTALALVVAGLAVVLLREEATPRAKVWGRALGLLVAIFGALVLVEYLFFDLGFDQLLFADSNDPHPGRPSPHTAVAFVLFGLAIAGTDARGRAAALDNALVFAFAIVVLFGVVGYDFGVDYLHRGSNTVGIAVHTLFALCLLVIGCFGLRPERGPAAILLGADAGARMARTWLPVAILGPLLLGAVVYAARESGLVGSRVGTSAFTLAAVVGLTALVYLTAARLRRVDAGLRRLAAVVSSSSDAIMSIDRQRRISSWNLGAERLLGYSEEEAVGRPVADLIPSHRLGEFEEVMEKIAAGEGPPPWETERQRKDGSLAEVELTVSPLRDARGRISGATAILRDVSERREAEHRFGSLLEATPDPIVIVDEEGRVILVNRQVEAVLGYTSEELVGRSIELLVPEPLWTAHLKHRQGFMKEPRTQRMGGNHELAARHRDGHEVPVEVSLSPLQTDTGLLVIAAVRDVSERVRTQRALAESEERFRRSFEHSGIGMALVSLEGDAIGTILEANDAFATIIGYPREKLRGMDPVPMVDASELPGALEQMADLLGGGVSFARREIRLVAAGGERVWASVTGSVVHEADGSPSYLVVQIQDISERKRFEGQLQYLADHDPLTGLFNRRRFEEELEREILSARRFETTGAVLVLDLDHFKLVNDSFGHAVGDELIAAVSEVLRHRVRESDVLGRMGGDEFAVVLPRSTPNQARQVAEELLSEIREDSETSVASGRRRVTASLGIAVFSSGEEGVDAQELLAEADIAMYDAKEAGRDRVVVFDPGSPRHERTQSRLDWMERIESALAHDHFVLHAQPILSLDGDRVRRFELLLRMVGEDGDLIPPGSFLPLAERSDLGRRIDHWVVRKAVEMLSEQEALGRDVCFEVNLSGGSIGDPGLAEWIARVLEDAGVDPRRLVFEVTETEAIVNVARAKDFAQRLRELGCGFALDDFGAGFASFYYLKHLSFDILKIDGEFIRNLPSSHTDQLVVQSVVEIARGLGKRTVAEFVGSRETVELLRRYGVDFAQGYYLGWPQPLDSPQLWAPTGIGRPGR